MDGSQSFSRRNMRTIDRGTVADHGVPADDDVMPSLLTTGSAVHPMLPRQRLPRDADRLAGKR